MVMEKEDCGEWSVWRNGERDEVERRGWDGMMRRWDFVSGCICIILLNRQRNGSFG
jgi:hypothetical protein